MRLPQQSRFFWLLGVAVAWAGTWLAFGMKVALQLKDKPHPFLPQIELNQTIKRAVLEWALSALVSYLIIGLCLGLVGKVFTSDRKGANLRAHLNFSSGLVWGLGVVIFFHGVLWVMVPMGLVGLPLLKHLPMGLSLLIILGGGAWLLWRRFKAECPNAAPLRLVGFLVFMALLPQVPHDLMRRNLPLPPPLPRDAPRVLLIGIDGVRKDLFERHMPAWKAPDGINPVCVAPATRRSWSMLLGKDPEKLKNSIIMPFKSDLGHPEEFRLLALAREKNLRTAWAIDDSLTAGFGNQPNWFTTVRESPGGWKYWFTLGMGTVFPVFAWSQNYVAPIENTNPWADINAYWRDIGRLAETHHWVFSHTCALHEPIRLTLSEIQTFRPWRWLGDSAWSYRPYISGEDALADQEQRADMRSSALGHYSVRMRRVLRALEPVVKDWERRYPHASGLVTSDHGELHIALKDEEGIIRTHIEGFHGFSLDPHSMWVPLHAFGATRTRFAPGQNFTWVELRDAMQRTAVLGGDLTLEGRTEPFLVQFPTIRAIHLESEEQRKKKDSSVIDPTELLDTLYVFPNGMWFASDANDEMFKNRKLSSGLVRGAQLVLFNPNEGGKYDRQAYENYKLISESVVSYEEMTQELAPFRGNVPKAMTPLVQPPGKP